VTWRAVTGGARFVCAGSLVADLDHVPDPLERLADVLWAARRRRMLASAFAPGFAAAFFPKRQRAVAALAEAAARYLLASSEQNAHDMRDAINAYRLTHMAHRRTKRKHRT